MDMSKTIVVGNEFLHPLRPSALAWLDDRFEADRINLVSWDFCDIPTYRNRVVRDIVLPRYDPGVIEWALFIDNDVTITAGVDEFLSLPSDVASCRCKSRNNLAWVRPDSFHCSFWFARIEVFQAITAPWFSFGYSSDGCEMLQCECQTFAEKVTAAGISIASGGWCGHANEGKWCG